jgi:serine/threonine protein kinase
MLPIRTIPKSELNKGIIINNGPYQIGKGPFAESHIGTFRNSLVAIKVFYLKTLPNHLMKECEIYSNTSHPNLLHFYGICNIPGKFYMVTELMPFSLRKFYHEFTLSWDNIFNFAEQIANGLSYLHSRNYSHKHLKSNNIFLNNDLIIKIADYDLSKIKLESSSIGFKDGLEATVRWRAPESFTREYPKFKDIIGAQKAADIYSYGLLLWEMPSRKIPFDTYTESSVVQLLSMATRVDINDEWPGHFKQLLNNCWKFSPTDRPSIDEILITLQSPEFNISSARLAVVDGFNKNLIRLDNPEVNVLKTEIKELKILKEKLEKENLYYKTHYNALKFDLNKLTTLNTKLQCELDLHKKELESLKINIENQKSTIPN